MPLLGPPNVEKLKQRGDLMGLPSSPTRSTSASGRSEGTAPAGSSTRTPSPSMCSTGSYVEVVQETVPLLLVADVGHDAAAWSYPLIMRIRIGPGLKARANLERGRWTDERRA